MNSFRQFLLSVLALIALPAAIQADEGAYVPTAGQAVATWDGIWHDVSRSREIPVKIYYPADPATKPVPVIIFSHGLGGSKDGYEYLGEYWAAHGYVSVHIQHHGSDADVMEGTSRPPLKLRKLTAAMKDPANLTLRPADIAFTIDELTRRSKDKTFPLYGKMDLDRLAVAGHSYGAYTVMAVAGQGVGPDSSIRYFGPDQRIKAAIAMSGQPAHTANLDDAYAKIRIPIFHMTGTKDGRNGAGNEAQDLIIGNTTPVERRVAYDHTQHAPAYLLTFQEGDHMLFSGHRRSGDAEHDDAYHRLILQASTAFWDATLKGNAAAQRWIDGGGLAAAVGSAARFEEKKPK